MIDPVKNYFEKAMSDTPRQKDAAPEECECPVEGHMTGCPNDLLTKLQRHTAPESKPTVAVPVEPLSVKEARKWKGSGALKDTWINYEEWLDYIDSLIAAAKEGK